MPELNYYLNMDIHIFFCIEYSMECIRDSVETSVTMKLFKTKEEASYAHIFHSSFVNLPMSIFHDVENFDPNRLQHSAIKAYPLHDRPRGEDDINSVKYYQKQETIPPIWMIHKKKKYILLDGAHRIVASYIEGKQKINAYVIH